MATKHRNLSQLNSPLPSAEEMKFGIVVAEWNPEVTEGLLSGAVHTLRSAGCPEHNIQIKYVPGTFELSLGAQFFAEYTDVDAVIVLGCVIQGDTRHFDFVCQGVTQGVMQLQLQWNMPIAFGVLTTNDLQQALDRSGGRLGNKGDEAAAAAIQMVHLQDEMDTEENALDRKAINRRIRRRYPKRSFNLLKLRFFIGSRIKKRDGFHPPRNSALITNYSVKPSAIELARMPRREMEEKIQPLRNNYFAASTTSTAASALQQESALTESAHSPQLSETSSTATSTVSASAAACLFALPAHDTIAAAATTTMKA